MEGLGSLELESSEDDDDIVLKASLAELGDYRIRIVDHPDSVVDLKGNHYSEFVGATEKTTFLGVQVQSSDVWRAKGTRLLSKPATHRLLQIIDITVFTDVISQSIVAEASAIFQGRDPKSPPDPSYMFKLGNKVQPGSNLFAFQKVKVGADPSGGGPWGFDVFFERVDTAHEWTCRSPTSFQFIRVPHD